MVLGFDKHMKYLMLCYGYESLQMKSAELKMKAEISHLVVLMRRTEQIMKAVLKVIPLYKKAVDEILYFTPFFILIGQALSLLF
jgi:hypothetical protein